MLPFGHLLCLAEGLCLAPGLLCAAGPAMTMTVADAAVISAAPLAADFVPDRPIRLVPPADLAPDPARLRPGLGMRGVRVWLERSIDRSGEGTNGWRGQLALSTGERLTEVFGFLHFATVGTYALRFTASGRVRLTLAALLIHEAAAASPEGFTPPLPLTVTAAGWYPLSLTVAAADVDAVLLQWQRPDRPGEWEPVPEENLAH